ncbi:branched-chain amino acid transport system II carrier protein [Vibrio lentus]|nr:branched-chain amino acid transport system II carrier protein [Vibrio lentus]
MTRFAAKLLQTDAATAKYLISAGCIAAAGQRLFTSLCYSVFFLPGATSATVAAGADNGGAILSLYVQSLFAVLLVSWRAFL